MGEVYRARDTRLGRTVAIKVLPAELSADPRARERFLREARAISNLQHPHICTLFDTGSQDGIDYLVMEHLEGNTLADLVGRGPLPVKQILRYGIEMAGALDQAHRQGIVHRDLKPGNVMITSSGAKVLDFGLAKTFDAEESAEEPTRKMSLTEEGAIVGTLQYMAPEQLEAKKLDARTDIFALGVILYEMATGRRAFDAKSRAALIAAILEREPEPVSKSQPLTPPALEQIIRRCLAKSPDDRLQSARDLQFALESIVESQSGERVIPAAPAARRTVWYAAAAALLILLAGLLAWTLRRDGGSSTGLIASKTFAVLPFDSLGVDPAHDYLKLAIPDEITTILSYNPALVVRPFSVSRHMKSDVDPRDAAAKLNAAGIISGHIRNEGGRLAVTLEVIDVGNDKLFWRDGFDAPASDLLAMRRELTSRIRNGLMPKFESASRVRNPSAPKDVEAYSLFLRAAALPTDPEPNREGIALLERSLQLDPSYAPAWNDLGQRLYYFYSYGGGGRPMLTRALQAYQRALQLDPGFVDASTSLIVLRAEAGHAAEAWREASALVKRWPDNSNAHFALSYTLRYGGMLEESAAECEKALAIDPGNREIRSCAQTFVQLGQFERADDFANLDQGSEWARTVIASTWLWQGRLDEARKAAEGVPNRIVAGVAGVPGGDVDAAIVRFSQRAKSIDDGEPLFMSASQVTVAGRKDVAFEWLRESIRRGFCGYPTIESAPIFAPLRDDPRYDEIRESSRQCHQRFLRETGL